MWQNGRALIPGHQLHRVIPSAIRLWVHSAGGQSSSSVLERNVTLTWMGYCSDWLEYTLLRQSWKWFLISIICSINNNNSHEVTKQSLCLKYRREVIGPERHYQLECSIFAWFTIFKQFKQLCPINLNAQTVLPLHRNIFYILVSVVPNTCCRNEKPEETQFILLIFEGNFSLNECICLDDKLSISQCSSVFMLSVLITELLM